MGQAITDVPRPSFISENIENMGVHPPSHEQRTVSAMKRVLQELTSNVPKPLQKQAITSTAKPGVIQITRATENILKPEQFKTLCKKIPAPTLEEITAALKHGALSEPEFKALCYFIKEISPLQSEGISKKTLIKILKEYYATDKSNVNSFIETKEGKFAVSLKDGHNLQVLKQTDSLGQGTFGHVSRVIDVFAKTQSAFALKLARTDLNDEEAKKAHTSIVNEGKIIQLAHVGGVRPGIASASLVTGINKVNADKAGLLGHVYEASGEELVGIIGEDGSLIRPYMPNFILAHGAYQLLQGLEHLHDIGVVHGDIRPGNCLVNYSNWEAESTTWVLADLGDAQITNTIDMAKAKIDPLGVLTTWYVPLEDQALAEKYSRHGANEELKISKNL